MPASLKSEWMLPAGLIVLALIPVAAGAARLVGMATATEITPDNARFLASPLPVVLHIVGVTIYSLLGAFQFAPGFRRRHPGWHRIAGRILVPAGLVAAVSGLWMSQFYVLPPTDGVALWVMRLVVGIAMALSLILGVAAVLRRDIARHQAWMMRAYGLGMGAGTQVVTSLPWILIVGPPDTPTRAILLGAGWLINIAVVEWILANPARRVPVRGGGGRARLSLG